MKKSILVIILAILVLGLFIGYKVIRKNNLLSSGESVLLINKEFSVYTLTDHIEREDITSDFKVIDKVAKLSEEEFAELTEGLTLVGTNRDVRTQNVEVDLPEQGQQLILNEIYTKLPAPITELCDKIEQGDLAQHCTARHAILMIIAEDRGEVDCEKLYPEEFITECLALSHTGELGSLVDNDKNGLIDLYEFYANPLLVEVNP